MEWLKKVTRGNNPDIASGKGIRFSNCDFKVSLPEISSMENVCVRTRCNSCQFCDYEENVSINNGILRLSNNLYELCSDHFGKYMGATEQIRIDGKPYQFQGSRHDSYPLFVYKITLDKRGRSITCSNGFLLNPGMLHFTGPDTWTLYSNVTRGMLNRK